MLIFIKEHGTESLDETILIKDFTFNFYDNVLNSKRLITNFYKNYLNTLEIVLQYREKNFFLRKIDFADFEKEIYRFLKDVSD